MTFGYIYCFSNPAMPGLLKVGMTGRTPEIRLNEANKPDTWIPLNFELKFAKKVLNPKQKETTLHILLSKYTERINPKREFFRVSEEEVKVFFDLMEGDLWNKDLKEEDLKGEDPEKEELEDDDDDELVGIIFEGIEYMMDKEDMTVLDPDSMETVGIWDEDSEEIEFMNDEYAEKHEEYKNDVYLNNRKNRNNRDMSKCFKDGQRIRHSIGADNTWTGTYDYSKKGIMYDKKLYTSLSGFATMHYKIDRPDRNPSTNGWKECKYEVNGKWIPTLTI